VEQRHAKAHFKARYVAVDSLLMFFSAIALSWFELAAGTEVLDFLPWSRFFRLDMVEVVRMDEVSDEVY